MKSQSDDSIHQQDQTTSAVKNDSSLRLPSLTSLEQYQLFPFGDQSLSVSLLSPSIPLSTNDVYSTSSHGMRKQLPDNQMLLGPIIKPTIQSNTEAIGRNVINSDAVVETLPTLEFTKAIKKPQKANKCENCQTESAPTWRKSPTGGRLCNACGLYLVSVVSTYCFINRARRNSTASTES